MIRPKTFEAKLILKSQISEYIFEYTFESSEICDFIPGQFFNVLVNNGFRRPFSIVEISGSLIKLIADIRPTVPGHGSGFFREIEIGKSTIFTGPIGRFTLADTQFEKVFISTGAGIAPFIPMIRKLTNQNQFVTLFHGIRVITDDIPFKYLQNEIINNQIKYFRCVTRDELTETTGVVNFQGRVTNALSEFLTDLDKKEFYVCGNNNVVKDVKAELISLGADRIFIENYG